MRREGEEGIAGRGHHAGDGLAQQRRATGLLSWRTNCCRRRRPDDRWEARARPRALGERLGHEARRGVMPRGHALDQALELHGLVHRRERALAVLQRDLELAGCVLGHHRAGGQALRGMRRIQQFAEQRCEVVQRARGYRPRCGFGLSWLQRRAIRQGSAATGLLAQPVELQLAGEAPARSLASPGAVRRPPAHGADRPLRRAPSSSYMESISCPVRSNHGARLQRAGHRPAQLVRIAGFPDQAGGLHVRAGDVEAQDGTGHVAALRVQRRFELMADARSCRAQRRRDP